MAQMASDFFGWEIFWKHEQNSYHVVLQLSDSNLQITKKQMVSTNKHSSDNGLFGQIAATQI